MRPSQLARSIATRLRQIDRRVYFSLFWTILAHALTHGSLVLRELAIASRFGVSAEADTLILILFIPAFFHQYLIANYVQAGVPIYLEQEVQQGALQAREFHGNAIKAFGGALIFLGLALFFLLNLSRSGIFDAFKLAPILQSVTRKDVLAISLILVTKGLYSISTLGLLARQKFTLPALVSSISPLLLSVAIFAFRESVEIGTLLKLLVIGQTIELILVLVSLSDESILPLFRGRIFSAPFLQSLRLHLPLIAGSILMGLTTVVERWRLIGLKPGDLSAYKYASLIITLPTVVLTLAASQISLTYFSRLVSEGLKGRLAKVLVALSFLAALGGFVTAGIFTLTAELLTRHIYAFGIFKTSDHRLIAEIVVPFTVQIPFYLIGVIFGQALSSLRANHWIAIGSGLNLVFHFLLSGYLAERSGAKGIALATSLTYGFSALFLSAALFRVFKRNDSPVSIARR